MPIYEYVCTECNNKFEKLRPASKSAEPAECPSCHKEAERVFSRVYAFSSYAPGLTNPLGGGSSCSSCSSGSCSTCGSSGSDSNN